jgi:hypothetical protein
MFCSNQELAALAGQMRSSIPRDYSRCEASGLIFARTCDASAFFPIDSRKFAKNLCPPAFSSRKLVTKRYVCSASLPCTARQLAKYKCDHTRWDLLRGFVVNDTRLELSRLSVGVICQASDARENSLGRSQVLVLAIRLPLWNLFLPAWLRGCKWLPRIDRLFEWPLQMLLVLPGNPLGPNAYNLGGQSAGIAF